jgi:hypothetical protein
MTSSKALLSRYGKLDQKVLFLRLALEKGQNHYFTKEVLQLFLVIVPL